MDIHIKLEFPSIPSGINLVGLVDYILSANPDFHYFAQTEVNFRFNCDVSLFRCGSFYWPVLSFTRKCMPCSESTTLLDVKYIQSLFFQNPENYRLNIKQDLPVNSEMSKPIDLPQWVRDDCLSIKNGDMKLCKSGVGGTYFVYDPTITNGNEPQNMSSVFKPIDEEPGGPNNPKQNPPSFIPMMEWGGGAYREVAAYKLDKGFVGVPETYFVEGTKKGSLQKFVKNDGDCSDVGANKFSIEDVHRIGIFDIRVLNMDRNDENLLVQKSSDKEWKLIPIDHTYAFPKQVNSYFNWQYWNQTKKPFSNSNLDYISSINSIEDALMLLETGIDEESVRNVTGSTLLLQKSVNKGFNLFEIASMVTGKENDLVKILSRTKEKEDEYYLKVGGDSKKEKTMREKLNIFKNITEAVIDDVLQNKLSS